MRKFSEQGMLCLLASKSTHQICFLELQSELNFTLQSKSSNFKIFLKIINGGM